MPPRVDRRIAIAMRTAAVPIEELRQWDRNPHSGDVEAVRRSLVRFGQVTPIVRAPDGWIIAGNTTLKAAIIEGWTQVAAVTLDAEEAEQFAFALASNRTAQLGTDDDRIVLQLLSEVGGIEGTGYSDDDLADMRARIQELNEATPTEQFFNPGTGMREGEPSMDERLDAYTGTAIRSMILNYELARFEWVAEAADRLRARLRVETNADLFVKLMETRLRETAP